MTEERHVILMHTYEYVHSCNIIESHNIKMTLKAIASFERTI